MKPNYTSWCSVKIRLPSQVAPFSPTNFLRRTGSASSPHNEERKHIRLQHYENSHQRRQY